MQDNFIFSQSWLGEIPADISDERKAQITNILSVFA